MRSVFENGIDGQVSAGSNIDQTSFSYGTISDLKIKLKIFDTLIKSKYALDAINDGYLTYNNATIDWSDKKKVLKNISDTSNNRQSILVIEHIIFKEYARLKQLIVGGNKDTYSVVKFNKLANHLKDFMKDGNLLNDGKLISGEDIIFSDILIDNFEKIFKLGINSKASIGGITKGSNLSADCSVSDLGFKTYKDMFQKNEIFYYIEK